MDTGRLNVINLGIALGITWGGWLGVLALGARLFGWGTNFVFSLQALYPGYAPTFTGTAIGGIWGLVCGFICGAIIALVYNFLQGRRSTT